MTRCLVVDDSAFDRKVLRKAAESCKLTVELVEAADARAATSALAEQSFDCILLDFRLPGEDGLAFARRLLKEERISTPLVMLTGEGSEQLAVSALDLGILDYIAKADLSPMTLERALSNALKKAELARDRKRALDEVHRSNEALSKFAQVVSHDLRAPLRNIDDLAAWTLEDFEEQLPAEAKGNLLDLRASAKRMEALIDGLLSFARLNKPDEHWETVPLERVVGEAIANLAAMIEETGAAVGSGPLPVVEGVPAQLLSLFQNLIGNGIKFQARGQRPEIHIEALPAGDEGWRICVRDNGIGVPPAHKEKIFEMLERLHSHADYEGSGIGLATCRRIVENHEGRIWVESEPGKGSRFWLTLPTRRAEGSR